MTHSRHPLRLFRLLAPAVALGLMTAAAPALAAPHEYTVTMGNMTYGAVPSGIKVGDTIVWVNRDSVIHTATARDHSFDIRANPGQSVRMTVKKAGTIPFFCVYHSMMRGTLNVGA